MLSNQEFLAKMEDKELNLDLSPSFSIPSLSSLLIAIENFMDASDVEFKICTSDGDTRSADVQEQTHCSRI